MAANTGDLNGSGPFYIRLDVNYNGNQYSNGSEFNWAVYMGCSSNGWGTFGIGGTVSVNIGGNAGSWALPNPDFRPSGSSARMILVAVGTTWIPHNADGTRPGFENFASIDSNHGSVGDGSVGGVWVDAPRIAKVPPAPSPVGLDLITATSMRYRFSGNGDGGSAITAWQWRAARSSDFTDGSTGWVNGSGTEIHSGLIPATEYFFQSRGLNAVGPGAPSAVISARTLAAAYVGKGGAYPPAVAVNVGKGSAFVAAAEVRVGKGGTYVTAG